jgi:hypothetical protein
MERGKYLVYFRPSGRRQRAALRASSRPRKKIDGKTYYKLSEATPHLLHGSSKMTKREAHSITRDLRRSGWNARVVERGRRRR